MLVKLPLDIGPHLRVMRVKRGLKLKDEAAKAGMQPSTLSRIEAGEQDPKFSTVARILSAMEAGLTDLQEEFDTGGKAM